MPQAEDACQVTPVQCQPIGCAQTEGGSCPYSPLAVYLPGIVPAPQFVLVSPPAGGRSGKEEQGYAALPGKKAELWAGQAVDGRRNIWFPFAKLSLTVLFWQSPLSY